MRLSRDQRRKRTLAERQRRFYRQNVHLDKERLAHAVHKAVCEYHGDDGLGHCADYAFAGAVLLSALTKKRYIPQAGSLWVNGDPGDPTLCMAMLAEADGIYAGEFHSWIVGPVDGQKSGPMADHVELIDLSARHFKRWVERPVHLVSREAVPGGQLSVFEPVAEQQRYLRPVLPYVWCRWPQKPEWAQYKADEQATNLLWACPERFRPVIRLAMEKDKSLPTNERNNQ
jgi:hypothetical protein